MERTTPPSENTLRKYRYLDTNTTLVNTIETLNNQVPTYSSTTKEDIETIIGNIVEEVVEKGKQEAEGGTTKGEKGRDDCF